MAQMMKGSDLLKDASKIGVKRRSCENVIDDDNNDDESGNLSRLMRT